MAQPISSTSSTVARSETCSRGAGVFPHFDSVEGLNPTLQARDAREPLYKPLDSSRRETRLVTVKTGLRNDPIVCEMGTISLDDRPLYIALSYVWGDTDDPITIAVNGRKVNVTQNLAKALRYQRCPEHEVIYWIDAICINQSDFDERRDQVRIMLDIYRTALEVVSWLGERDEHTRGAQEFVKAIETDELNLTYMENLISSPEPQWVSMYRNFKDLVACTSSGNREYWRRLWIVQEITAARQGIYMIEDFSFNYLVLLKIEMQLLKHGRGDLEQTFVRLDLETHQLVIDSPGSRDRIVFPRASSEQLQKEPPSLLRTLLRHGHRECSDPRDRIFGLLGISDLRASAHPGLQIDHQKSVKVVFAGAVQAIIETSARLDILMQCTLGASDNEKWPSWVPTWLTKFDQYTKSTPEISSEKCKVQFDTDTMILYAQAVYLGVTDDVFQQIDGEDDQAMGMAPYKLVDYLARKLDPVVPSINGQEYLDTLYFAFVDLMRGNEQYWDFNKSMKLAHKTPENAVQQNLFILYSVLRSFTLFSMKPTGAFKVAEQAPTFGFSKAPIRPGDKLYWFVGCSVPMVVRPKDDYYVVVGPCYMHKIAHKCAREVLQEGLYREETIELR